MAHLRNQPAAEQGLTPEFRYESYPPARAV